MMSIHMLVHHSSFNVHPHTHTHTHTHTQIAVQSQEKTLQSTWRELPDVPYSNSAACVVDGVLLAIGGLDDLHETSAIYALHPVDQKWQHVGDMPFECSYLDNSGSDSRNLIGQLQVSKRGRNLERDSKCQWGGF